tara:strand:- start:173 stop:454 length:282 start_codon:yes stop_codon:yes gene_type:complete
MISEYHFTSKTPLSDAVIEALNEKPKILERKTVVERVIDRLRELIQTFDEGWGRGRSYDSDASRDSRDYGPSANSWRNRGWLSVRALQQGPGV